jgi:beta-lactamase regulating signal transducer with metallopeptidase domain
MTAWLLAASWKGTLLVAFALLVQRFARNRVPARWLCALLLLAIVRLITPIAPEASFSVFNLLPRDARPHITVVSGEAAAPAAVVPGAGSGPRSTGTGSPISPLLAVWAAGVAFVVLRTTRRMILFHRQLAGSRDVARDDVLALLDECRTVLGIRRRVRIATTGAVVTPALHGWLRPALLLPTDFLDSFTPEQVRYVFLHELAHLRRSDVPINWIATAAQAVHWFNPLVHLAVARLAEERELACDAVALEALRAEERPAYGGTVLEIVDRLRTAPLVPALVGMTATPQQLKRRILMIASFRRQSRHSVLFAALVVAVGFLTLTDASAGEPLMFKMRQREPLPPAAAAALERMEQSFTMEFESAAIEDVLHAVSNATGATITIAPDAITEEIRQQRLALKASNMPAHLVLMESLHSVGLGARFTDTGVEVVKADPMEGARTMVRFARHPGEAPEAHERVIVVGEDAHAASGASPERAMVSIRKMESVEGRSGVRTLRFRTGEDAPEGTLEIEVKKQ